MTALYLAVAVAGAWLALASYKSLLCPPRIGALSEARVLGVLLGAMLLGLLTIVGAGVAAVAG